MTWVAGAGRAVPSSRATAARLGAAAPRPRADVAPSAAAAASPADCCASIICGVTNAAALAAAPAAAPLRKPRRLTEVFLAMKVDSPQMTGMLTEVLYIRSSAERREISHYS